MMTTTSLPAIIPAVRLPRPQWSRFTQVSPLRVKSDLRGWINIIDNFSLPGSDLPVGVQWEVARRPGRSEDDESCLLHQHGQRFAGIQSAGLSHKELLGHPQGTFLEVATKGRRKIS